MLLVACGNLVLPASETSDAEPLLEPLAPGGWAPAGASFVGRDGDKTGRAVFTDAPSGGVLMRVDLQGLTQGWHGMHLHMIGDCSDPGEGFKASGGHIDPDSREHGLLNPDGPERADLPNIYAGADGRATAELYVPNVSLVAGEAGAGTTPLVDADGFAVIVHLNADDHRTQPIGGAGERVACAALTPER